MNADAPDWRALTDWAASEIGLTLSAAQIEQLQAHLDTLLLWNSKIALVSQHDPAEILNKHFADSLFVASRCTDGEDVADLGSGAGFPGIPIAVVRPASRVCLVEARSKKASFLEEACRRASLRNLLVCNGRIETVAAEPSHRAQYAVATARALTTTAAFLALAQPLLAPGGRAIAMRSVGEDRIVDPPLAQEVHYVLPDGTPRRLVIVRY